MQDDGYFKIVLPDSRHSYALLSEIRSCIKKILPFPLREITSIDVAAVIAGYTIISSFDNSLSLAMRGVDVDSLSPQAEAVGRRAAGYAEDVGLVSDELSGVDAELIKVAQDIKKWSQDICGPEYSHVVLLRVASDLGATLAHSTLPNRYVPLTSTLNLVAGEG